MKFSYSKENLGFRERLLQRCFEILPGLTSWSILLGMIVLCFIKPLFAALFVIAFDLYWILRLFYVTIFLSLAYFRLASEESTDWMSRIRSVERSCAGKQDSAAPPLHFWSLRRRISQWIFQREVRQFLRSGVKIIDAKDILHLVILPVSKEKREILEPSVLSLSGGSFPAKQILVAIALEDYAGGDVKKAVREIQALYADRFFDFRVIPHTAKPPEEARVKGANITFAAKEMTRYFSDQKIPFENVIVSCFDADTVADPNYFACLTYQYLICPKRTRASFQPIPVYNNNIWQAPGFARVLEMGSSFFQLAEATNPEKLVTFSSHSMSFKALVETDYWPVDMISDDSSIFWKSFIHFDGDYRVVPLYVTVSMDTVDSGSWRKTAVNIYKQKRRWAWGIENFPILMRAFLKTKKIPLVDRFRLGFKLFEGHIAWATWAFILTVIGWLPAIFAGREFSQSVLYYTAPRISGLIFNLSSFALLITILFSMGLLPRKRIRFPILKRILFTFQWLLLPVIFVFLSALPALDAQTRLMFGRYMEFWITDKRRRR